MYAQRSVTKKHGDRLYFRRGVLLRADEFIRAPCGRSARYAKGVFPQPDRNRRRVLFIAVSKRKIPYTQQKLYPLAVLTRRNRLCGRHFKLLRHRQA